MIGSISPLVKEAHGKKIWTLAVGAYAIGSVLASGAVGGLASLLGTLVGVAWPGDSKLLAGVAALATVIELTGNRIPGPLPKRQTKRRWRYRYGPNLSAFFWGIDLGLGVTTRVTFASYWVLLFACVALADPVAGIVLLGSYGLGRAILVASGPFVVAKHESAFGMPLLRNGDEWHQLHTAVAATLAVLVILKSSG